MEPKSRSLVLLSILAIVILASGCTGLDPQALATSNSMIKQFMNEHPNAKIVVTHFSASQVKNIIDQIRSDCDNPYIDEKEFYRVTINDTQTSFYAVVWIDWTNKTIECAFKIGTEGKIVEKPKEGDCESHASYKCDSGNLYWFDSCGNKQEKKQYCQYGCSENKCLGECKSHAEYRCYGDNVYWFDSCGNKQDKKEYCDYGCENGFCKPSKGKTCEQAGGYCIYPGSKPVCGNGICESGEADIINVCPVDTQCQPSYKGTCPQDCMTITPPTTPPSGGGGGGVSDGQAICENKCASPDIQFADFWADKETYLTGAVVRFYAKLIDNNGNPATPEEGNKVYIFAVSPTAGSSGSSALTNYNYSSGYYEATTPPIPTSNVESGTWIFFATAENSESFAGSGNVYVKINPTASTASPTANPAPYEGCINRCLMRFRMSEPLKPVMQPPASSASGGASATSASTGMVVATETTATSKIVSYQCQAGYEVGKYFCREGGMCCVPKTAPSGFCGSSTQGPCSSDSECITGGCSGQVCQSVREQSVTTTCEYSDCYNAEKYGMKCKCIIDTVTPAATAAIIGEPAVQGRCKWVKTMACTLEAKICPDGTTVGRNPNRNCEFDPCPTTCGNGVCETGENNECYALKCEIPPCGETCKEGTCPQDCKASTCTDSDGGKNYYVKGYAYSSSHPQKETDFCDNSFANMNLREYYCDENGNVQSIQYNCPYGCTDGACIQQMPDLVVENLTLEYSETKVAGIPSYIYTGYVKNIGNGSASKSYIKVTISPPQTQRTEGGTSYTTINGATFPIPMNDLVSGDILYPGQRERFYDYFNPSQAGYIQISATADIYGTVVESNEYNNNINNTFYVNKIFDLQTCTDSDGGINIHTKGITNGFEIGSKNTISKEDYCKDSSNVVEFYCDGPNSAYNYQYVNNGINYCPNGCSDGACIQQSQTNQICTENTTCKINEGDTVIITTSTGNHTIKNIGVSSSSVAVISVDNLTKDVTQFITYLNISGLKIYVQKVYFPSQVNQIGYTELIVSVSE
jgi:eight-cysteine-cluster-containing protein